MSEITYLPEIECSITPGIREDEWSVRIPDENGKRQNLRVNKSLVSERSDMHYLAIGVVDLDYKRKRALVELPHEADSGVNRLWIPFTSFRKSRGACKM
jgi:hypothetical protein